MSSVGPVIVDPLSAVVTVQRPPLAAPGLRQGPRSDAMALSAPGGLMATGITAPALLWFARKVLQQGPEAMSPKEVVAEVKKLLPKDLRKTRVSKTPTRSPWKLGLFTVTPTAVLAGIGATLAVSSRRHRRAERARLAARAVAVLASPRSSVCSSLSTPRESTTTPRGSVIAPQRVPTVHRMASKSPPPELSMGRQKSVSQWYRDDEPAPKNTRSMGRVMSMGRDTAMRLRDNLTTMGSAMSRQASLGQWYRSDPTESQPMGASLSQWYQADPTQSQAVGMDPTASVGQWYKQSEPVVDITGCESVTQWFGAPAKKPAVVVPPVDWLSEDDEDDVDEIAAPAIGLPCAGISFDEEEEDRAVEAALREETTNSTGISDNDADVDSAADTPVFPVGNLSLNKPVRRQTTASDSTAAGSEDAAFSEASFATSLSGTNSPSRPFPLNQREPAQKFHIASKPNLHDGQKSPGRHSSAAKVSAHEIKNGHIASARAVFEKNIGGTVSMPIRGHRGDLL
mmetsp:Transcript_63800/g.118542  ORF Transcript_63800/g.118542 Transcript_63800/m.118542 type:complete len:512 (-) Transcript_63800:162-1697(-)